MALDRKAIDHLALLARLDLTEAERDAFALQLDRIVHAVDTIGALELAGVEPTSSAVPVPNVFREDLPEPSLPREAALDQAPAKNREGFVVPRVIGGGDS